MRRALLVALSSAALAVVQCRSPSGLDAGRETAPSGELPKTAPERPSPTVAAPIVLDPRAYDGEESPPPPAASASAKAGGPVEKKRFVVAAVGDSLTDPRSHGGKYLAHLRKRCPESQFDSYGKGGDMVNQMRRRFVREVVDVPPPPDDPAYTHVIVFGGVNDLYSDETAGRTVEKIEDDLGFMYDAARERGLRVVAVTVTPWGGFTRYFTPKRSESTRELNAWILEQARIRRIDHAVDAYSLLSCGDPERLCPEYSAPFKDGLHFGPAGHERLGQALYEAVFSDCR